MYVLTAVGPKKELTAVTCMFLQQSVPPKKLTTVVQCKKPQQLKSEKKAPHRTLSKKSHRRRAGDKRQHPPPEKRMPHARRTTKICTRQEPMDDMTGATQTGTKTNPTACLSTWRDRKQGRDHAKRFSFTHTAATKSERGRQTATPSFLLATQLSKKTEATFSFSDSMRTNKYTFSQNAPICLTCLSWLSEERGSQTPYPTAVLPTLRKKTTPP